MITAALLVGSAAIAVGAYILVRHIRHPKAPPQHWCPNCQGLGIAFRVSPGQVPEMVFCDERQAQL